MRAPAPGLRRRLALSFALAAAALAALYGGLVWTGFVAEQEGQLRAALERELDRLEAALGAPALGPLLGADASGVTAQLVAPDGSVALPRGAAALPAAAGASARVAVDGRPHLVAARPWGAGGSLRVGLDLGPSLAARGRLLRNLVAGGLVAVALAALAAVVLVHRALGPLARLAAAADRIDPIAPAPVPYDGPADEVGAVAAALNRALEGIRGRKAAERRFLAEVAHELAAPLTVVAGEIEGLERDGGGARLGAAASAARELLHTSQDLLCLARGELERPLRHQVLTLRATAERVLAEYPGARLEGDAGRVVGDPDRLAQAVRNLVRNAVQATGDPARVRLRLADDGAWAELAVHDDGPGLPPERLARVFEAFCSGGDGLGVGLGIARDIAERHGGMLAASSAPGRGSAFTLRLPTFETRLEAAD